MKRLCFHASWLRDIRPGIISIRIPRMEDKAGAVGLRFQIIRQILRVVLVIVFLRLLALMNVIRYPTSLLDIVAGQAFPAPCLMEDISATLIWTNPTVFL